MRLQVIIIGAILFNGVLAIEAQNLYIRDMDNTQNTFTINEIQKITFSNDSILISEYDKTDSEFKMTDIQYLSFFDYSPEPLNIKAIQLDNKMYPNPTSNVLNINSNQLETGNLTIKIIDLQGKIVKSKQIKVYKSGDNVDIDVSNLKSSVYLCIVTTRRTTQVFKFLKN